MKQQQNLNRGEEWLENGNNFLLLKKIGTDQVHKELKFSIFP